MNPSKGNEVCGICCEDSQGGCGEHGTQTCGQDKCLCPSCSSVNPVIILETALATLPNLLPHQTLIVEDEEGVFHGISGPADFLLSVPRWGTDLGWECMPVDLAVVHSEKQRDALKRGQSWYRVENVMVSVTRYYVDSRVFTASVFDGGDGLQVPDAI